MIGSPRFSSSSVSRECEIAGRRARVRAVLLLVAGCLAILGTGEETPPILLGTPELAIVAVPSSVSAPQGASLVVRVDVEPGGGGTTPADLGTGLVDFSIRLPEQLADIDIQVAACAAGIGTDSCREWTITPGTGAIPGRHSILIFDASPPPNRRILDALLEVHVATTPTARTPPAVAVAHAPRNVGDAHHALVLTNDGALWAFGSNFDGQVGASYPLPARAGYDDDAGPRAVLEPIRLPDPQPAQQWVDVAGGNTTSFALDDQGGVWGWGRSGGGQLGVPGSVAGDITHVPVPIPGLPPIQDVSVRPGSPAVGAAALSVAGQGTSPLVYYWGSRSAGGLTSIDPGLTPADVVAIAGGMTAQLDGRLAGYILMLDGNGTVWSVGDNADGQLGRGTGPATLTPGALSLTGVVEIVTGQDHSLALDDRGEVWAWGSNAVGQLGDGTTTTRSQPVRIPIDRVVAISASGARSTALRDDGSVWIWGEWVGPDPRPVAGLDTVIAIGGDYAIRGDCNGGGTLWRIADGTDPIPPGDPIPFRQIHGVGLAGNTCQLPAFHGLQVGPGEGTENADGGLIESAPGGIDCGTACANDFAPDAIVDLIHTAGPGRRFHHWRGDPDCFDGSVGMLADTDCEAYSLDVDVPRFDLRVTRTGTGSGQVASDDGAIVCGTSCVATYDQGTTVVLTAQADPSSTFVGFTGNPDCADGSVTMDADVSCAARFDLIAPSDPRLTVVRGGVGIGTVTSQPAGIDCGDTCDATFPVGQTVTLVATPAQGSQFVGFTGDPGCSAGSVLLDVDRRCVATFSRTPPRPDVQLIVGRAGGGSGRVVSSPPGIDCATATFPAGCTMRFPYGTVVTFTVTADPGSVFIGWNGPPSGTQDCQDGRVTLDDPSGFMQCFPTIDVVGARGFSTITISVTGSGRVTTPDGFIDCPGDCFEIYTFGNRLFLGATPGPGGVLNGWTGDCAPSGAITPAVLDLDVPDSTCGAVFSR